MTETYSPHNLRLYTFVNFYLSSIQQGIQSAHVATAMSSLYRKSKAKSAKMLQAWEDQGRTMIVLNGGMAKDIADGYDYVGADEGPYPFAYFMEEEGAIHECMQAMTAWGIVLPLTVYDARQRDDAASPAPFELINDSGQIVSSWANGTLEHRICSYLKGKSLAR